MRAAYDPAYTKYGRDRMPDHQTMIMRQTITLLHKRHGITRTEVARASDVHRVLITRLFKPEIGRTGEPKGPSKAYAHKICRGLILLCRRHNINPAPIEDMLR